MNDLPSMRQRITRLLLYISLAWGMAVSTVIWAAVHYGVNDLLDGALQESAELLFGLLVTHKETLPIDRGGALPAPLHAENLVWQLVGRDQSVELRSHTAPEQALLPVWTAGFADAGPAWRVYGIPLVEKRSILYVAQRSSDRRMAAMEAAAVTAIGTLVVGLLFIVLLRNKLRHELAHLQKLSQSVLHFDPLQSDAELLPVARSELQPIHRAVTDLAKSLAHHVANERAFAAHAAHALRTPLAGMDAQLAMALRECPPAIQPRLQRTRDAANRLTRVVTALLSLFRSGTELNVQAIDLAALIERIPVDNLSVQIDATTTVMADPDLLAAALMNVLDNAVRYGARNVCIDMRTSAKRQMLLVLDDGPGIGPAQRRRMRRVLKAQDYESGHVGLGLMLADLVARAHGGALHLLPRSTGFAVVLTLQVR